MNESSSSLFDFFLHFLRHSVVKIGGRWAQARGKCAEGGQRVRTGRRLSWLLSKVPADGLQHLGL